MFNRRPLLIGLGMGVMIGAMLLQLMNMADEAKEKELPGEENTVPAPLTTEGLEGEADRLGYRIVPKEEKLYSEEEMQKAVIEQTQGAASGKRISAFVITNGMSSDQVGSVLLRLKLIQDKDVFQDELRADNLITKLQPGTYAFEGTPSIAEIIAKITKVE